MGGLIGVLVVSRFPSGISKAPLSLLRLFFVTAISSQIIASGFRSYNIATPLIKQYKDFVLDNFWVIKIDDKAHKFLTDINLAISECGIDSRTPFLGLYNIPGVALASQATPLLSPWLNNVAQAEFVLERISSEALQSVIVAINFWDSEHFPSLPHQLSRFPDCYKYCGVAIYPLMRQRIEIWQSKISEFRP